MSIVEAFGGPPNDAAPWLKDDIQPENMNKIVFHWRDLQSKAKRRTLLRQLKRNNEGVQLSKKEQEQAGVNALAYHLVAILQARQNEAIAEAKVSKAVASLEKIELQITANMQGTEATLARRRKFEEDQRLKEEAAIATAADAAVQIEEFTSATNDVEARARELIVDSSGMAAAKEAAKEVFGEASFGMEGEFEKARQAMRSAEEDLEAARAVQRIAELECFKSDQDHHHKKQILQARKDETIRLKQELEMRKVETEAAQGDRELQEKKIELME